VAHQPGAISVRDHGCAEREFASAQGGVHEIQPGRRHGRRRKLDRLHHGARQRAGRHRHADREGAQRLDEPEVRPDGRQHASGARCTGHAQQPRRGQQRQPQALCRRHFLRQNRRLDRRTEIHLPALRDCRRGRRIRLDHAAGQPTGAAGSPAKNLPRPQAVCRVVANSERRQPHRGAIRARRPAPLHGAMPALRRAAAPGAAAGHRGRPLACAPDSRGARASESACRPPGAGARADRQDQARRAVRRGR